jgi:uncharacterized protein YjbI with pentapeptide repeats
MSDHSIFNEYLKVDDDFFDDPFGSTKELYVLTEPEAGKELRIKPNDLKKHFPVDDFKWGKPELPNQGQSLCIEVSGSYFPDYFTVKGLHFISVRLSAYLAEKIDLEPLLANKVAFYCPEDERAEDYYLIIPEEVDCIRQGSIRYEKDGSIVYLEIDEQRLGEAELFKAKGFSRLIITTKLNRLDYTGYECIRLENYFNYAAERERNYQARISRGRLDETLKRFERKADAAGNANYMLQVKYAYNLDRINCELQAGFKKIWDSYRGAVFSNDPLTENYQLFSWSWPEQAIKMSDSEPPCFGVTRFELPGCRELWEACNKLPEDLQLAAQAVGWEIILHCLTFSARLFSRYEKLHANQRFRLYIRDEQNRESNPALFYDFKCQFQLDVEAAQDLRKTDLSGKALQEYDFTGQNLCGLKIADSDLRQTHFDGCDLTKTEFHNCILDGAKFINCNLSEAVFNRNEMEKASFSVCNLKKATLAENELCHAGLIQADLSGALINQDLSGVYFYKAKLIGTVVQLPKFMYNTVFRLCDLRSAQFSESRPKEEEPSEDIPEEEERSANIRDENQLLMELVECDFTNSDLSDSCFAVDRLTEVKLVKAKLVNADFSGCNAIAGSDFRWSACLALNPGGLHLNGNNFAGVNLAALQQKQGAVFSANDFSNANLSGYDFTIAGYPSANNLRGANLSGCKLDGADLSTSIVLYTNFQGASLNGACFDEEQLEAVELSARQKNEIDIMVEAESDEVKVETDANVFDQSSV